MSVAGLAIEALNRNPVVLLRDPSGRRQVPIWIDHAQAQNIMIGIHSPSMKRPLTHDLIISLLEAGNLKLDSVLINEIDESAFQAVIKLRRINKDKSEKSKMSFIEIDARPSDAIALAVRTNCSIWMMEKVVAEASIPVDINADEKEQSEFKEFIDQVSPSELVRHLKKRGLNDKGDFDYPDSKTSET